MDSDDDELMNIGAGSQQHSQVVAVNSQQSYNSDSSIESGSDYENDNNDESIGNRELQQLLDEANAKKEQDILLAKAADIRNNVKTRYVSGGSSSSGISSAGLTINLGHGSSRSSHKNPADDNIDSEDVDIGKPGAQETGVIRTLEDTVNAIDKEKNIDSKNLSKEEGLKDYTNHVVHALHSYNPQKIVDKLSSIKKQVNENNDLISLDWETLWTNSFLSKLDSFKNKNSFGQVNSDQCKLLFYLTALQTCDTERDCIDLIYQRSLFLQSLVSGRSITHAPRSFDHNNDNISGNTIVTNTGSSTLSTTSRRIKNNYFGWRITFDDFIDVFNHYGVNMRAIREAPINNNMSTLDALSLQNRWNHARQSYFRKETPNDDVHACDDEDSDDNGFNDSDDDFDDEYYINNNITPIKKKKEKNYFDKENMPSISSIQFVVKFLRLVDIDVENIYLGANRTQASCNSSSSNTKQEELNACEQVVVALILLRTDAVLHDVAISIQDTILKLWKKYIDNDNPIGRKVYVQRKLREIDLFHSYLK